MTKKLERFFRIYYKNYCNKKSLILNKNLINKNASNTFINTQAQFNDILFPGFNFQQSRKFSVCSNRQNDENSAANQNNQVAKLDFYNGNLKLTITLPARNDKCEFTLKLLNDTLLSLIENIKLEDKSVEKVQFFTVDGTRIAQNTQIGSVVSEPFRIKINDSTFDVTPPSLLMRQTSGELSQEDQSKKDLEEIKKLVAKLYLHLNVEQYETEKEENILKKLELLKNEIQPMEKIREDLALKSKKHTNRMVWLGLGLMSIQAGIMARLTWFDYSWDIVEPISYFVSYSAVVGVYAYFVLTRKEYDYESASDRIFLRYFHKNANRNNLDVNKYNQLKNSIYTLEADLKRIKNAQLRTYQDPSTKANETSIN